MGADRYNQLVEEYTRAGDGWATFKALKQSVAEGTAEVKRRNEEAQLKIGGSNAFTAQAAALATDLAGDQDTGELPMVKLGDASIAAPFTSKLPSIRSVLDIVRQGRCTLVSTIQMQQAPPSAAQTLTHPVLALECLISAYSMSALYLDGVSKAENQLVATGLLLMVASLAFSYARPVQKLSPVRPITSLFHPAIWVSIAGQLLIHLGSMTASGRGVSDTAVGVSDP
ncbi:hypothetical protein T484DRAFT_1784331 [Baffinella frigidus]|nr:hypothetical protein T484DRAFT_1784331 [Cryptophyta sp. CCMP2293]